MPGDRRTEDRRFDDGRSSSPTHRPAGRARRWLAVAAATLVVVIAGLTQGSTALAAPTAAAAAAPGPPLSVPASLTGPALSCPSTLRPASRPTVLLVHGTGTNAEESWSWGYDPALTAQGWQVCTVNLPDYALGDIQVSSEYVVAAVRSMTSRTGGKVDLIGHSQGNLEIRWALKWWPDVLAAVDDAILLGSPSHGVATGYLTCALSCFPAAHQMTRGSHFIDALNAGDETPGSVSYTSIYSLTDQLVVPPSVASPLTGASNIAVQSLCHLRPVTHGGLLYDAATFALVDDALSQSGPADVGRPSQLVCSKPYLPGVTVGDVTVFGTVFAGKVAARILVAPQLRHEPPLAPYAQ